MNRAVGYGRVSTLGQATDGTSSDEQKRIITEECERKGWELVRFYSDEGYSGKNTLRPGFVQLLMDAKAGKFDTVVFTKLDRFGRSLKDMLNNLSELSDLDIRIYCINQPEINADGALGKALLQFLGIFAEFEHAMIAERTKQGRKAAWKSGQSFIGTMPFGYKLDRENGNKIIINKEQKAVYDKIVSMYLAERLPTTAIALELNRQQLPPPTNRGMRRWYYLTIIRIPSSHSPIGWGW
jgi:site-specific DNA recombinase